MRLLTVRTALIAAISCIFTTVSLAQTFTSLLEFNGTQGSGPAAGMVQGIDGNFYGSTSNDLHGGGTIFRLTAQGLFSTVYSFCSQAGCPDGRKPNSSLVEDENGNLYGTTFEGGSSSNGGVIFELTHSGKHKTLHRFCLQPSCADGFQPSGLVRGFDGDFYGTTDEGGGYLSGTVFKITPNGTLTTLYNFCSQANCLDGSAPNSLMPASDGNLYGTTYSGGTSTSCPHGCGTLFQITPTGSLRTIYSFCTKSNCTDGEVPTGQPIEVADGNLYGMTNQGGLPYGNGTAYQVLSNGRVNTIYRFCTQTGCTDGNGPVGMIQGSDGNFYGATGSGGTNHYGNVFQLTTSGVETTLYSFCLQSNCTDGSFPESTVLQGTDGNFYGTTYSGGGFFLTCGGGCGTLFRVSMGLAPFVAAQPNASKVGRDILILGNGLTGTTTVTFNAIVATFTVESDTLIKATVPPGATTGSINVTTTSGTLTSNVPFHVRH